MVINCTATLVYFFNTKKEKQIKKKTKKMTESPALGGVLSSVKREMKAAEEVNGESQELPCSGAVLGSNGHHEGRQQCQWGGSGQQWAP